MSTSQRYDVAIVGASIAGCTAAILFGRRGARVALIERHADPGAYKTICTHFIQSSAVPVLGRLGLAEEIAAAGGLATGGEFWTRWGWIRPPAASGRPAHSLNFRREKLDPLLRHTAAGTEGVELLAGETVTGLVRENDRVTGVETAARDGERRTVRASMVVGADGRDSRVAELADVPGRVRQHGRFGYFAYYQNLPLKTGPKAQMWFLDPQVAYAFPVDNDLTLLAAMLTKDRLPEFRADPEASLLGLFRTLPDAPVLDSSRRISRVLGKLEMPNVSRSSAPRSRPGLAFIGDAAMASDPLWGVGCGFALQSAEWLVEATASALVDGDDPQAALGRYRRRHRSHLRGYDFLCCDYATGRRLNPIERLMFSAAARDAALADRFEAFGTRNIPVHSFLSPRAIARAGVVNVRHRAGRGQPVQGAGVEAAT
jgi:2-polyprenyl-6-methoxyphenol hydroxylase-like FAD-dependent oxidoreductase